MWCAHSRSGHFSPSWLAPLRFTSVEKRSDRLSIFARGLTGGLPVMFFEEVSSLSHVPVLRDINPSLDISGPTNSPGREFGRACAPKGRRQDVAGQP